MSNSSQPTQSHSIGGVDVDVTGHPIVMSKEMQECEFFCLHCGDVFPGSQLKIDVIGGRQGCGSKKYPDCDGAGFSVDIHRADDDFAKGCLEAIAARTAKRAAMSKEDLLKEQEDRIEEKRRWFFDAYQKTLNKNFSNRKGARKEKATIDAILRFQEAEDIQDNLLRREETAIRLKQLGAPSIILSGHGEREEEEKASLQKLLSRKSYRDSINLIFSNVLDMEKIEKFKKRTAMALRVSLREAEDIYKIGRRAPGSAYSGKRQR